MALPQTSGGVNGAKYHRLYIPTRASTHGIYSGEATANEETIDQNPFIG